MKSVILFLGALIPLLAACSAPNSAIQNSPQPPTTGSPTQGNTSGAVNILDYGAKCDGRTDDSAAILAALQTGKPIAIPVGTCGVGSSISFGGARIEGASLTGSVLAWVGSSPTMLIAATSTSISGNVATINTAVAHNLWPNETVVVQGNSNPVFDGTFIVTSIPTSTSFTYQLVTPDTSGSGGTIGMYYMLDGSKLPNGC